MFKWFTRIIRPPTLGYADDDKLNRIIDKVESGGTTPTTKYDFFIAQDGTTYSVINGIIQKPALGKTNPPGTSSSTSQSYQDPVYLEILRQQGKDAADQFWAKIKADREAADAQRKFLTNERLGGEKFTTGERLGGQTFTTGERLGRQEFDSGESQLGRQFTSGENTLNRQFQGAESMLGRQFTSGESAIDRAQRAGEFAANYSITKAQAQRQDREAALNAAKTYTELTASPDLTGFQRFLSAGGGSVGNALQRGATSMTREGQLGGARALQVSEQPLPTYMDYSFTPEKNPYAGATNQYMNATNQYANAVNPVLAIQRAAVPAATIPAATVPAVMPTAQSNLAAHIVPTAANSSNFENRPMNAAEISAWSASIPGAPYFVTGNPASPGGPNYVPSGTTGLAYGTGPGAMPIYRSAYGTQDMPRYGFGTQTNRLLGRPDRLPVDPEPINDPFSTIPDALVLSDQGRAALEGTRGKWDFEDWVRGYYQPMNSRLKTDMTETTGPHHATNAHEFTHSAQSRNAIDLDRFVAVLQKPEVIKDVAAALSRQGGNAFTDEGNWVGGVGYPENLQELIDNVAKGKIRKDGPLGTSWGPGYDRPHLYTAISEAYGGRAYNMPAELRGFFPHLQQTESADDPNAEAPRDGRMRRLQAGAQNKLRDFIDSSGVDSAAGALPDTRVGRAASEVYNDIPAIVQNPIGYAKHLKDGGLGRLLSGAPPVDHYDKPLPYDPRYFPLKEMMEERRARGGLEAFNPPFPDTSLNAYRALLAADTAAKDAAEQEAPLRSDFSAYGTGGMPRYALGTQDMPVGMDTQFMSGDSTSLDPMSGGARPETVSINDPTGDATFSVDPLQPPDGPSEGGRAAELSALLKALSQFLDKGEEPAPMPVAPRYAFGTYMMPGYAYGTGIMESDNPYIDRVMAQRQATPYTMNTQAADYSFGSPTLRSINEMGAQVATGVPMVEFGYEANRLRPGMLSRDSLNLGQ